MLHNLPAQIETEFRHTFDSENAEILAKVSACLGRTIEPDSGECDVVFEALESGLNPAEISLYL